MKKLILVLITTVVGAMPAMGAQLCSSTLPETKAQAVESNEIMGYIDTLLPIQIASAYYPDNDMSSSLPLPNLTPNPDYSYDNDMSSSLPLPNLTPNPDYSYDNDMSVGVPVPGPWYDYDNDMSVGVPVPGPWYDYDNDMSVGVPVPDYTNDVTVGVTVYRTDTGLTYHAAGCEHTDPTIQKISLVDAINIGLQPCPHCY
ncbi:hypothetical protein AN396_11935 [Candidatus Epulonipiscium fishelsonii]|uniref:Uncharacterized protein n=1 Tax=Candidatus Epulonipiscium fishelsonii TaxID=77094 RepID=A0ACC8X7Y8_9FIRM|nr:hypothetical protein AN396_11935 [Epulopiscium sp. SCG-B11WGA-EpuloA1]